MYDYEVEGSTPVISHEPWISLGIQSISKQTLADNLGPHGL